MLIAARSSQDFACCSRATASARSKGLRFRRVGFRRHHRDFSGNDGPRPRTTFPWLFPPPSSLRQRNAKRRRIGRDPRRPASDAGQASSVLRTVSTDEINDLTLLQAPQTFNEVAVIRATAIHPGDAIIAIGYPLHGLLTSDFTVTSGIVSSLSGLLNDTRHLQISAEVQSGNSGGPLLDTSGEVVGVVSSKLNALKVVKATGDLPQNINFAIKTGAMRDFSTIASCPTKQPNRKLN
jgi:hypothetical protein